VQQSVRLNTALHGVAPELAGTVSVLPNGLPTAQAGGRNSAIPWSAVTVSSSTSGFIPPNRVDDDQTVWLFDNLTGIVQLCLSSAASNADLAVAIAAAKAAGSDPTTVFSCTLTKAQLISGYINFSDSSVPATAQQAVTPTGLPQAVQIRVHRTAPSDLLVGKGTGCYTTAPITGVSYVSYYCAVPTTTLQAIPLAWSGYAYVLGQADGQSVCRYTRYRDNRVVPDIQNIEHPNAYLNVITPLANQNFLVVKTAGTAASDSDCPYGTPLPTNYTTFPQPTPP
jgi:hypothetical protein